MLLRVWSSLADPDLPDPIGDETCASRDSVEGEASHPRVSALRSRPCGTVDPSSLLGFSARLLCSAPLLGTSARLLCSAPLRVRFAACLSDRWARPEPDQVAAIVRRRSGGGLCRAVVCDVARLRAQSVGEDRRLGRTGDSLGWGGEGRWRRWAHPAPTGRTRACGASIPNRRIVRSNRIPAAARTNTTQEPRRQRHTKHTKGAHT
jgi:hypothetical protein